MNNGYVKTAISIVLQTGIAPCFAWGPPGTGKSEFAKEIAKTLSKRTKHSYEVIETFASDFQESMDFRGIPIRSKEDSVRWVPPYFVKRAWELHERGVIPILFIDEFSHASLEGQAAMMKLLLEKLAGENKLPEPTRFILASNSPDDLGGNEIMSPLRNRGVHFRWEPDNGAFIRALISGEFENPVLIVPDNWRDNIRGLQVKVAGFLTVNPRATFVNGEEVPDKMAFPTHRSWWKYGIPLLAAARAANAPKDVEAILLGGSVGEETAIQFLKWEEELDLPKPEEVLENPAILLELHLDQFYATTAAIAAYIEDTGTTNGNLKDILENGWEITDFLFEHKKEDMAVAIATNLIAIMNRHGIGAARYKSFLKKFFDLGVRIGKFSY